MIDTFQEIGPSDSRYAQKQRDIAQTISKMQAASDKRKAEWESQLGDMLDGVTEENVLRGGGDRSVLHGSAKFRVNYQKWLDSLGGK